MKKKKKKKKKNLKKKKKKKKQKQKKQLKWQYKISKTTNIVTYISKIHQQLCHTFCIPCKSFLRHGVGNELSINELMYLPNFLSYLSPVLLLITKLLLLSLLMLLLIVMFASLCDA